MIASRWFGFAAGLAFAIIPVLYLIGRVSGFLVRDHLDIYALALGTPLGLIFPLVVSVISCAHLSTRMTHRWIANTRTRSSIRTRLSRELLLIIISGFTAGALFGLLSFLVAFVLWPSLGDIGIDPEGYYLTEVSAARDSVSRYSYTQLLVSGSWAYGMLYSAWVGISGAAFGAAGFVALAVIPNKLAALTVPFAIAFTQNVLAAIVDAPQSGIIYSIFPFGLQQTSIVAATAPLMLFAAVTATASILVLYRANRLTAFA